MPPIEWKHEHGLQVLYMGEIDVGRVAADGGRKNSPRYIFNLRRHFAYWKDEKTVDRARLQVELALKEWLRQAGIITS